MMMMIGSFCVFNKRLQLHWIGSPLHLELRDGYVFLVRQSHIRDWSMKIISIPRKAVEHGITGAPPSFEYCSKEEMKISVLRWCMSLDPIEDFMLKIFFEDLFIYVSHDCHWGTLEAFDAKVLKWELDAFALGRSDNQRRKMDDLLYHPRRSRHKT